LEGVKGRRHRSMMELMGVGFGAPLIAVDNFLLTKKSERVRVRVYGWHGISYVGRGKREDGSEVRGGDRRQGKLI